jgi:transcription elongation factor Elf1
MNELTVQSINEAVAAGAKTFASIYRHLGGEGKAPGGFANRVRKIMPGIFGTPSVESLESMESVEKPVEAPVDANGDPRTDLPNEYNGNPAELMREMREDAPAVIEDSVPAPIPPADETTPVPCLLCGTTVNVEKTLIPADKCFVVVCRSCSARLAEQEAEEQRVKTEQDRIAAMKPGPERTAARRDLKWGKAPTCPHCGHQRFQTRSKADGLFVCLKCNHLIESKPGQPPKDLGKAPAAVKTYTHQT